VGIAKCVACQQKSGVGIGELTGGSRKSDGWESPDASPASKIQGWAWENWVGIARVTGGNHQMRRLPTKFKGGHRRIDRWESQE